jgi:hypothetical protein
LFSRQHAEHREAAVRQGGYGKVFKVKERSTGNHYALKVIEVN